MKLFLVSRKVSAETSQERATPTPTTTSMTTPKMWSRKPRPPAAVGETSIGWCRGKNSPSPHFPWPPRARPVFVLNRVSELRWPFEIGRDLLRRRLHLVSIRCQLFSVFRLLFIFFFIFFFSRETRDRKNLSPPISSFSVATSTETFELVCQAASAEQVKFSSTVVDISELRLLRLLTQIFNPNQTNIWLPLGSNQGNWVWRKKKATKCTQTRRGLCTTCKLVRQLRVRESDCIW